MVSINIFDVDSQNNEVPLLTLQSGEHILGRGSFLNCTDKRISRNHILINIEDDRATIKSVHVNPCYYMSLSESKVQLLTKNQVIELRDGDKFAFLTDIWYRIKIVSNEAGTPTVNGASTITIPLSNKDSSATVVAKSSSTKISNATSPLKRSLEQLNSEGRKKLKTINENLDQLLENINEIEHQDYVHKPSTVIDNDATAVDDSANVTTKEVFRKKVISDSDDDSDVDMVPEVTRDTEVVTNVESSKLEDQVNENSDSDQESVQSDDEVDKSNDKEADKKEVPDASSEVAKSNEEPSENDVKKKQPLSRSNSNDLKGGVSGVSSNVGHEDDKEVKQERGDAMDASSSASGNSIEKKLRREQCWYGASCYRKNSSHREELSHPGDEDYDPDPNDGRPECSYGASCYRSNQLHRRQYRHPSSRPAPKPTVDRRRGRAAARTSYDYSDSGDEDGEPFSADGSSSSENDDVEDSDSDFSGSGHFDGEDKSEEMKIMYKEAKKFLRKDRKE